MQLPHCWSNFHFSLLASSIPLALDDDEELSGSWMNSSLPRSICAITRRMAQLSDCQFVNLGGFPLFVCVCVRTCHLIRPQKARMKLTRWAIISVIVLLEHLLESRQLASDTQRIRGRLQHATTSRRLHFNRFRCGFQFQLRQLEGRWS
jgi:hypothetical protein